MLLEEDNFRDWVSDAKRSLPVPTISVPDTPVANVEIRLVEPTPVPSRVGSLGGSIGAVGLLSSVAARSPARLREEPEAEETVGDEEGEADEGEEAFRGLMIRTSRAPSAAPAGRSPRKRGGKFFVHSSPSKGSASDSSAVSPTTLIQPTVPSVPDESPTASTSALAQPQRKSSGSSTGLQIARSPKKGKSRTRHSVSPEKPKALQGGQAAQVPPQPPQRRHVSLSTMRGKFAAEKRKAAEAIAAKAAEVQEAAAAAEEDDAAAEESGWEDEDEEAEEDWSDDDAEEDEVEDRRPGPSTTERRRSSRPSLPHRNSSDRAKSGRSSDNIDLSELLQRPLGGRKSRAIPPPPAPTPLTRMSKKERAAAAAERAKIEAELEAQRQREMFAKQQIFGTRAPGGGLLSGLLKSTGSMVNLVSPVRDDCSIRLTWLD